MKKLALTVALISTLALPGALASMDSEKQAIEGVLISMLNAVDGDRFKLAESHFTKKVFSDYSELSGQPGAEVKASEMVGGWKAFLGPVLSHHMLTNLDIEVKGNRAESYSHFYARHEFKGVEPWDVYGRYFHKYVKTKKGWKISHTKLILHGIRGNKNFFADVQARSKESKN